MSFPKYIKCTSLKDKEGRITSEWVVRLYDNQIEDENGNKIPTPPELLNRYYTCKLPFVGRSIFSERPDKFRAYMTMEEIEVFRSEDKIIVQ